MILAYKLLDIYKRELSLRVVFFKHFNWKQVAFHLTCIFILIVLSFTISWLSGNPVSLSIMLLSVLVMPNLFKRTEEERTRIYNQFHYGLNYYELRMRRLRKFLKDEGIDFSKEKIAALITLIDKQADEHKIPFLVGRGVLAAILIPIWVQGISWVLNKQITRIEEAVVFIVILLAIIFLIWMVITAWKKIIYDEIINSDYNRLKLMSSDLRELVFKMQ
ncbi:hypothetical protein D3P07_03870 [Paenibacillus sp. 1011MAR3C5]|uniref:hypothetical protein n=1 Tax=Paenibacillus sp. 1011MAR3C5 TaxID=1675787 RepID=UPI000E6C1664|nr:hypothetical protein [Paenibacillus sp. 1011MAR3C5]RJE91210.1 hypothetical protein D3P07_03870 [Paenibacillus sp. 1011MAR3C5]